MEKSVLIAFIVFLVFVSSFTFFLYDEIFHEITGRQVFLDSEFEQPADSFKPSKPSNIFSLSPSNCELKSISLSHTATKLGETVSVYVNGNGCYSSDLEIKVFEKDKFFDDEVTLVSGKFIRDEISIDFIIDEKFDYFFDELFEGDDIELYFETNLVNNKLTSDLLFVYLSEEDGPLLQPSNEEKKFEIKIIFWMVFVILVAGIAVAFISILSSFKRGAISKN
ncbi:MAG: hypothetical protein AABX23_05280 [Nanoarchaeota archaeon]